VVTVETFARMRNESDVKLCYNSQNVRTVWRLSRDYAGVTGLLDWPAVLSRDVCHVVNRIDAYIVLPYSVRV